MSAHPQSLRSRLTGFFEDDNYRNAFVFVVGMNAILIFFFYNKGWIPGDDGWYGHVSRRMANGAVFPRDIQELHPGYIHFVHVAAMKIFGTTLVAMRVPLMALMAIQSIGVYLLFRRTGWVIATTAAAVMCSLGALEIASATPGLYAEALGIAVVAVLINVSPANRYRLVSVGVLLGLSFMFRQLTAAFLVYGTAVFLFCENQDDRDTAADSKGPALLRGRWMPQATFALMLISIAYYLWTSSSKLSWLLFGIGPMLVLVWAFNSVTITNRRYISLGLQVLSGSLLSMVPMLAYLLYHKTLGLWFSDTFVRAFQISHVETVPGRVVRFWDGYVVNAFTNLVTGPVLRKVNAIYWFFLFACSVLLAAALLRRLWALYANAQRDGRFTGLRREYAMPIVAIFYAQVTIISEVPYYLYLTVGFTIIASLWMWKQIPPLAKVNSDASQERLKRTYVGFVWFAIVVALIFHAGQPFTRNHFFQVSGKKFELVEARTPNLGLYIPVWEDDHYFEVVEVIHANSDPDDSLLVLPATPELYVFAERDHAFRMLNSTLSFTTDEEVAQFYEEFERATPDILAFDNRSVYNAGRTPELIERISKDFELITTINDLDIYKHRGDNS